MSKIFQALRKSEGEMADLALPMVESEIASAGEASEPIHEAAVTEDPGKLPEIEPLYSATG